MSNAENLNPRAQIGGNDPPLAQQIVAEENFAAHVTSYLEFEYREIVRTVTELMETARTLPAVVDSEEEVDRFASVITRIKDCVRRAEGIRVKEKEPYLRGGTAIDQFFFGLQDQLARRPGQRNAKAGAADVLQARLDHYQQEKLARERAERERVAAEERRRAEAARQEQERLERERLAAEEAARRARKPETIAAKTAVADQAAQAASVAASAAETATDAARSAHIDTLAKPADLVRTRTTTGPLVTMAKENYAIVIDQALLDRDKLWPFIPLAAKEQALRAWAKSTGHSEQMPGAEVGSRNKTVIR